MHGMVIAFDGIDGCGKDLQIELVKESLEKEFGFFCTVLKEPWRSKKSPCGLMIDHLLKGKINEINLGDGLIDHIKLQKLYLFDRLMLWTLEVLPRKEKGEVILLSRDRMSTYAYGHAYGIPLEEIDSWHSLIPKPDLYLYFHVSPKVALERILSRSAKNDEKIEYFEEIDRLRKISTSYEVVYQADIIPSLHRINANNDPERIRRNAISFVAGSLYLHPLTLQRQAQKR